MEKLKSFYYLVTEANVATVASRLDRHPTTIWRNIKALEEEYRMKFFNGSPSNVKLTSDGKKIFKLVKKTLSAYEAGRNEIIFPESRPNQLRILTTSGIIGVWLAQKVTLLAQEFPDVHIATLTTNIDFDFDSAKADIGILPEQMDDTLSQKKVRTLHPQLFASPAYIKKHGMPANLEDLKHHRLISYYGAFEGRIGDVDWHLAYADDKSAMSFNSGFLLFEAARNGAGIITLAEEFEYFQDSGLIKLPLPGKKPTFDIYYVRQKESPHTKIQKRFLEILRS